MRMALAAAGKTYEDYTFGDEKDAEEKTKAPYGVFPYMVYKGKMYGESKAIASFIARECGLAGKTSEEEMRVDEVYCLSGTVLEDLAGSWFEPDETKRAEKKKKLEEETMPKYMSFFEKMLKENGTGYVAGSALTLGDLAVYDIAETVSKRLPEFWTTTQRSRNFRRLWKATLKIKAYIDSRKPSDV